MISQDKISADLARALADAGVVSDPIPPTPDPYAAARLAYLACSLCHSPREWVDLKQEVLSGGIPRGEYYRKLIAWCQRALEINRVSGDDKVGVTFAWGYFTALKASQKTHGSDRLAS